MTKKQKQKQQQNKQNIKQTTKTTIATSTTTTKKVHSQPPQKVLVGARRLSPETVVGYAARGGPGVQLVGCCFLLFTTKIQTKKNVWLNGWLVGLLAGWFVGWVGWLVELGWFVGRLVGWCCS